MVVKENASGCIQILLEYGFKISRTSFLNAVRFNKMDYIYRFIDSGYRPDKTSIIIAGHHNNLQLMNLLF